MADPRNESLNVFGTQGKAVGEWVFGGAHIR